MDGSVDLGPSMDKDGNLFWIRTPRRYSHAARAWWKNIRREGATELQITARPTTHVAAAPGGGMLAFVTEGLESAWEVRLATLPELETNRAALATMASIQREVDEKIRQTARDMERALTAMPLGEGLRGTQVGAALFTIPEPADIHAMGEALRASLKERFNLTIGSGQGAASRLDAFLEESGGRLEEHPAMILAIAGVLVDALPVSAGWFLENATEGSLSMDVRESRFTDGLTYQALLPFGAAREALAGRLSLEQVVRETMRDQHLPVYLLENLRTETLMELRLHQLREDGFDVENDNLGKLMDLLEEAPSRALATMATEQGLWMRRESLAMFGASRLARFSPTSPDALFQLADALSMAYLLEEALPFFEQAVALEPQRVELRIGLADCLLTLDRVDEAEAEYTLCSIADVSRVYTDVIAGRLQALAGLRAGATP